MSFISRRTITLPDLITPCPFPIACNAAYESASVKADAWLASFGIPYTESQEKYNLWSALSFPHSSSTRLQVACEVWTLLFLADDIMDSLIVSGSIDHSKRNLFQNMTECLQAAGSFKPLTPFAAALHDWWQRISVHATRSCQQRLIETYQQSNAASLQQMSDRNNRQTIPDLETYIYNRRDTSYGRVVCSFVEYSLDLNIPDQCWTNEFFKLLIDYATDTAAWTNDVYSFNLEQSRGDYNLVTVLQYINPSLTVQQAMDEAGQMITQRYMDFLSVRQLLPSWGAEIDVQVKLYVDALASGVIANAVWSFETPRYFGEEREQVKRTRQITLLARKDPLADPMSDSDDDQKESFVQHDDHDYLQDQSSEPCSLASGDETDDTDSELSSSNHTSSDDSENHSPPPYIASELDPMKEILSPFHYASSLSGKKVRSKLSAAFNCWFRIPQEKLIIIDEIIGMLHNASLMIDDIEDGSTLRRGAPAAHMVYGVPLTINAAELTCFLAMQKAMQLDHPLVAHIMINNLIELHKGQGCDIWWRDNHICPTEEEYQQMVIRKCGGLFFLIINLLEILSPVTFSAEELRLMNELCQCLALLFQIRDDYCNLMSAEYAQNKSYCEDLSEGKYSFIIIHALRTYPDDHRIHNILKQQTESIVLKQQALHLLHQFGSIEYTRQKCFELAEQSYDLIDKLQGNIFLKMIITQLMCTFELPVDKHFPNMSSL